MQLGFLLVVAGQVRKTNQLTNLSKIFFDIFITSISFYFIGYSFNTNAQGGFIGQGNVLTLGFESTAYVDWFFKFTLC
jgi:ammonia channel protein AmtB